MIQGKTIICEEVFVQLVRLAADRVPQVNLWEEAGGGLMSFAKGLTGKNVPPVSVEKTDAEVTENGTVKKGHVGFTLKVSVACDASIPDVIEQLREAVVKEVVRITDFQVDRVDIIVPGWKNRKPKRRKKRPKNRRKQKKALRKQGSEKGAVAQATAPFLSAVNAEGRWTTVDVDRRRSARRLCFPLAHFPHLCYDNSKQMFIKTNESGESHGTASLWGHRSEIFLCLGGMCGTGTGSFGCLPGGGGPEPDGPDHLPGGVPGPEGLGHPGPAPSVRSDPAGGGDERPPPGFSPGPVFYRPFVPGFPAGPGQKPGSGIHYGHAPYAAVYGKKCQVLQIYLQFMAPEDIHVYSVDEVLLDLTPYLKSGGWTPHGLVREMIRQVLRETGITATAGIGTNLYLCKVAMDIVAKHMEPDPDGVRIAALTERTYRQLLWDHCPMTDFWRIGPGITRKLQQYGMYTMGAVARMSLEDPDLLYHLFGVNAELLIDHAWGWEPCTLQDIRTYEPRSSSLGSGQVLQQPCTAEKARLLVWEMADLLALDLTKKHRVTDQLVMTLGYDRCNLEDPERRRSYRGKVTADHYGRPVPVHAHGSRNLPGGYTASGQVIRQETLALFDRIADPHLLIRKISLNAEHVRNPESLPVLGGETDLFVREPGPVYVRGREDQLQETILSIQSRYGKNALLRGSNLLQGAMTRERNGQVGGHRA